MTRVLIVDDKPDALYYLDALLTGHGFAVEAARHGAEALSVARLSPPDVVVSDLLMPVMDGYTLLRHWKADARLRRVPFMVYTATYTDREDERLAFSLGADAFLLKPADPDELLARLRETISLAVPATPVTAGGPPDVGESVLRTYSETLIRKLEEKTLQLEETNEALRSLIESIPQIVWIAGADGTVLDFNHRWEEYSGTTIAAGREVGWAPAVHPDDREQAGESWRAASAAGKPFEIDVRLRRRDGAYHWMLGRALPVLDANGLAVRWFGTFTDIEELKQAHERIGAQARLLDLTQDAIVVHDAQHRVRYWNKGAERLYGWSAEEAMGHSIAELHCPDLGRLSGVFDALRADGEWSGELWLVDRSGGTVISEGRWTLVPGVDGEPGSVLAVHTDITERKQLEAQFLRTQRLESIGALAGGIAHDLNNLLAPITMGVELLRLRAADDDSRELIDAMDVSAQRCADLVKRVLGFARGIDGARVDVRLDALIAEVAAIVRATFPKDIAVSVEVAPNLWPVVGDPTQLNQVLVNLCVNARDAMAGGGHLTIRADNVDADATGGGEPVGRRVRVEVADDGTGIAPEVLPVIFEPFVTTRDGDGGTGLGLSTVRGIVDSHGGSVGVDSRVGEGSCFSVVLPAAAAPAT